MYAIEIEDLNKTYTQGKNSNPKVALKNITLNIPEGAFFGLLGPNGAGKSTLINILAGLVIKTSGSAKIYGYDIDKDNLKARNSIGVVPQELVLDPFFTVRETLNFYGGYYGIHNTKRKTEEIISVLGLEDKADVQPRSLSGGMRRRLLVAKALVHSPKVLILDEPTAGVDIELRRQLWNYVKEQNRQGTTIVLTTHYLEEAEELCDHIAIINRGNIIASDRKNNLMHLLDYKRIIIKFAEELKEIPSAVSEFNSEIDIEGNLIINYKYNEISFDEILQSLIKINNKIIDIKTHEANLEDIFSYLIYNK